MIGESRESKNLKQNVNGEQSALSNVHHMGAVTA